MIKKKAMPFIPEIELNSAYEHALAIMTAGEKSVFITGKAGVGKSTLLNYFCKIAKKKPVLLAPTGVAALNIRGETIHKFFNFYIDVTPEKIATKKIKPQKPRIYQQLSTIIIDEISMVRADLLDCIDAFLRLYGPLPGRAFGGVQMVFVGDLCQLPPIVMQNELEIFSKNYASPYFFSARVFDDFSFETIELDKVYRQKEAHFVDLLNRVRNNEVSSDDLALLNSRVHAGNKSIVHDGLHINLTTTNKNADEVNSNCLAQLTGKNYCFSARIEGDVSKEYYPTAVELEFKIGAQIMMLNNDSRKRWVNGTVGVIENVANVDGEETVTISFQRNDRLVQVTRFEWEVVRFKIKDDVIDAETVGSFTQFPFRLAWAVTIHKSQGKTFEHVVIDLGKGAFASGQLYVALSRCTSFNGVVLKSPVRRRDIYVDPRIPRFLQRHSSN